jgi:hypothetical protein
MKKIILSVLVFMLFISADAISQGKKQDPVKKPNVEQAGDNKAKLKAAPVSKRTQKKRQKSRIKNHNEKKTNNMWKK